MMNVRVSRHNSLSEAKLEAGVDILQKKMPKNAQGCINSAQAKYPEFSKLGGSTP